MVESDQSYAGNGRVDMRAVAETLQEEVTVGYRPIMPLESLWMAGGDMPQITLRRDLEFMSMHPVVMAAMEYYRSGIAGAQFWGGPDHNNPDPNNAMGKPISQDASVSEFVLTHVEQFWQHGVPLLQEGYPYGWSSGEYIYKESGGMLVWSHLKDFHPYDSFVLTLNRQPVGTRVKNVYNKQTADLWFESKNVPAKACWYSHRPRFNQLHGRSQYLGAWRPWRRLGWRDAVEQVIDAAIYRAGYKGPIVRHPPEDMQTAMDGIPATRADAAGKPRRSARDVARQLIEWAKAGAGFTLSSAKYPQAQGGGDKWGVEWPEHVMDVRPLIEAARYLEDQIMLGMGVPPELIRAGGTGSGYSGRSIPREAFLNEQQLVANNMLQVFVNGVVKPLVLWNFGDIPFNVYCKSLLKTQTDSSQGAPGQSGGDNSVNFNRSQAAKDAWAKRKVNEGEPQPTPPTQAAPPASAQGQPTLSISRSPLVTDRLREIARKIVANRPQALAAAEDSRSEEEMYREYMRVLRSGDV